MKGPAQRAGPSILYRSSNGQSDTWKVVVARTRQRPVFVQ
jgi:hypothetical protein